MPQFEELRLVPASRPVNVKEVYLLSPVTRLLLGNGTFRNKSYKLFLV